MRPTAFNDRYAGFIDKEQLATLPIDIVGCGTIGRPVALLLAAMGADCLTLYDDDSVEIANLGNQGWELADIGKPKADALADACTRYGAKRPTANVKRVGFDDRLDGRVLILAVDSVGARNNILDAESAAELVIDGRIGGERVQVVCGTHDEVRPTVPEENGEAPCGMVSTLYVGYTIAGLIASQLARHLRGWGAQSVYQNLGGCAGAWGAVA